MQILVLGGTKFLGRPLVWRLVGQGRTVTVFHRGQTMAALPDGAEHILAEPE